MHLLALSINSCFRLHPLQRHVGDASIRCEEGKMNVTRSTILRTRNLPARSIHQTRKTLRADEGERKEKESEKSEGESIDELSEPTNCCMSGCANCVWIQYAEKLSSAIEKSDVDIQKVIIEKVQDPNMRAFLSMEFRCRNLIKKP